jgi:hypothetical protein
MSQDTPVYNVPSIFVSAHDSTLLRCTAHRMACSMEGVRVRWVVTDPRGLEYLGPPYTPDESPVETQRRVAEWWDTIKALAQGADGDSSVG